MLVFTTTFPVSENLTIEKFVNIAIEWVSNPHSRYSFNNPSWDKSAVFSQKDTTGLVELSINTMFENNSVAIRLRNVEDTIEWVSDFVLADNFLSVQLQRNSTDNANFIPNFHIPYILKMLIRNNYGGADNGLPINTSPLFISEKNIEIISDIIINGNSYNLPVVYVSLGIFNDYAIEFNLLAKKLMGIAHVLVEKDLSTSRSLQKITEDDNPYNGAIQVYFPKRFSKRFIPSNLTTSDHLMSNIVTFINERNLQMKIDDRFQYYYVVQSIQKAKRLESEKKHKKATDDVNLFAEMYNSIDAEKKTLEAANAQLQSELNDSKSKNMYLQEKVATLTDKLNEINDSQNIPLLYQGEEVDFYDGEQHDVLIEVLKSALTQIVPEEDPTPRRRVIIESILERNKSTGIIERKVKLLKQIFKKAKLSKQDIAELKKIGLVLVADDNHYKFLLNGDSRFHTTVAKTTSDKGSANLNAVTQIIRSFF